MIGFFFVSASLAVSFRSNTIFFPNGKVEEPNSRVRTVTYNKNDEYDFSKRRVVLTCFRATGRFSRPWNNAERSFPTSQTFIFCIKSSVFISRLGGSRFIPCGKSVVIKVTEDRQDNLITWGGGRFEFFLVFVL